MLVLVLRADRRGGDPGDGRLGHLYTVEEEVAGPAVYYDGGATATGEDASTDNRTLASRQRAWIHRSGSW